MNQLRLLSTVFLFASLVSCAGVATEHSPTLFVISAICWTGCVLSGLASGFVSGSPWSSPTTPASSVDTQKQAAKQPTAWGAELPPTLVMYVALVLFTLILELGINGVDQGLIFGGALQVFATVFLLMGLRMAWLFLVVIAAFDIVVALAGDLGWWTIGLNAVMLALLLAPPSWRFAQRQSLDQPAG